MISGKRGKGTEYPLWARAAQIMRCHKLAWFEGQGLFLGGSRQGSRATDPKPHAQILHFLTLDLTLPCINEGQRG